MNERVKCFLWLGMVGVALYGTHVTITEGVLSCFATRRKNGTPNRAFDKLMKRTPNQKHKHFVATEKCTNYVQHSKQQSTVINDRTRFHRRTFRPKTGTGKTFRGQVREKFSEHIQIPAGLERRRSALFFLATRHR